MQQALLEYVSGYESVQGAVVLALMLVGVVFMFMRRIKQHEELANMERRQKDAREFQQSQAKLN